MHCPRDGSGNHRLPVPNQPEHGTWQWIFVCSFSLLLGLSVLATEVLAGNEVRLTRISQRA